MGLRDLIAGNRTAVTVAAAVLLAVSLYILFARGAGGGPKQIDGWYFYDLDTQRLFAQPLGTLPPVATDTGPDRGVRTFVFTCGECTETEQFVHHLVTMTAEAKAALESGSIDDPPTFIGMNERIARVPEGDAEIEWLPRHRPDGEAIADETATHCNGQPAKQCRP